MEDKLLKSENNNSILQNTIRKFEKDQDSKRSTLATNDNTLTKFVEFQNEISILKSTLENKDLEIVDLRSQLNFSFDS